MKPEDIAKSVCELDAMWICREEQQDKGKALSEFASWKERICKQGRGTDAGAVRREGPVSKEAWGLRGKEMEEVVLEMSLKAWKGLGKVEKEVVHPGT